MSRTPTVNCIPQMQCSSFSQSFYPSSAQTVLEQVVQKNSVGQRSGMSITVAVLAQCLALAVSCDVGKEGDSSSDNINSRSQTARKKF